MSTVCDHVFVVITASASEEPIGLSCSACGRNWPVGAALPVIYDRAGDSIFGDLDEDEEAEHTTAAYEAMGWACEECDYRTADEKAALAHADEQKHSLARAPITKEQGETT